MPGREKKAASIATSSTAVTPSGYASGSEQSSTPATSAVPTPTAQSGTRIEAISTSLRRSTRSSLRQQVAGKRKRAIQDSEDEPNDDEDGSAQGEDLAAAMSLVRTNRWARKTKKTRTEPEDDDEEESLVRHTPSMSATPGNGSVPRSTRSTRSTSRRLVSLIVTENKPSEQTEGICDPDELSMSDGDDDDDGTDDYQDDDQEEPAEDEDSDTSVPQAAPAPTPSPPVITPFRRKGIGHVVKKTVPQLLSEHGVSYGPVVGSSRRDRRDVIGLIEHHPEYASMWEVLRDTPTLAAGRIKQPETISRQLKTFQCEGVAWMQAMEQSERKGGLLGDEMGLGKTIQAVSLIMSDWPAQSPTLVLAPPVALMQWMSEIESYTNGCLSTFLWHGTNSKTRNVTSRELKKHDIIIMSYNTLESMFRKQEKGHARKGGVVQEKSVIHQISFHRAILDEAHCIKSRTTMTAQACFALKATYRWCLSGTPLQNHIGEFFSLVRFLRIKPFALYMCKKCPCESFEWSIEGRSACSKCGCAGVDHTSVFNQQLLNPITRHGRWGAGAHALERMKILTNSVMLRRLKKDHMDAMELPVKEFRVVRQFYGEAELDLAKSIMKGSARKFTTYVTQGVLLNNYANIFTLITRMRQVADHPDLILKRQSEGGQNVIVCCICDEAAVEAIRSKCKHDFCRKCAVDFISMSKKPDCPACSIPLSIDLEQPELEQDEAFVKKSSIINRIRMENWTSSTKIEMLVHQLWKLRSNHANQKSIIFSQFTSMLQLIEWRLRRAGITTVMLDGSMSPAQRQASIDQFMKNPNIECFLVSLKAGGVALNLTEASRVFIIDPWWNPAAEWQSADRCHRIGQTRPCVVTRLCIEDSVESRVVQLQEKKSALIKSTLDKDGAALEKLSQSDLQFLFRASGG